MITIRRTPRRRRLGQHFLHDAGVIHRLIEAIQPDRAANLVEIGPGRGALTRALLGRAPALSVIELDRDLATGLEREFGSDSKLSIHRADALELDFRRFGRALRVVGNLPYNISTPLLFHLLDQADCIEQMVFMLQKEVVDRLCAAPGGRDYGRLSVTVQARCEVLRLFNVGRGAFQPQPRVESSVVRLIPRDDWAASIRSPELFQEIVRKAFGQRRKMLRNTLRAVVPDPGSLLRSLQLDGSERPESLSVAQFIALANAIAEQTG
ncbi:MAG: 16S rRNA (adenine(1518)-N(6)/adenine(1519)-N(6))-dimethyltransferase RsmA [Gammaproteobacteria bacterium]|nr:16S rRNA (adenine(1518)-N(6)/adenine(1519)-N(6))-dimethyltransferase RsmA [Gammaproteobacteria bacterium]